MPDRILRRHLQLQFHAYAPKHPNLNQASFVGVISDISELKRSEREMERLQQDLERRVEARTFELASTNLRLVQEIEERKQIESDLAKSREEYRLLIESMNEGLIIKDRNDRISYINKRFGKMLGYARRDIIGHSLEEFLDEPNRSKWETQIAKRKRGGKTSYELELTGRGRRQVWAKISPRPVFDSQGNYDGSFAVVTDISDRVLAEQALRKSANEIEDLYNNAPCGYHSLDKDGVFLRINHTALGWLGYTPQRSRRENEDHRYAHCGKPESIPGQLSALHGARISA